jgi:hypothetical protein
MMNAGQTREDLAICALHCPVMLDVWRMNVWNALLVLGRVKSVVSAVAAEVEVLDVGEYTGVIVGRLPETSMGSSVY